MSRGPWKRLQQKTATWEPIESFHEVAPNVWVPQGYSPTAWEIPTPIVRTTEEAAAQYARCADGETGLVYFALHFGWSLHEDDPSGVPQYRKIPAYPYVIDFLTRVQTVGNYHVEKSRQLLLSWLWMVVFLWDILFHDHWANVCFSIRENLVDDGGETSTPDSLFGKVRFLWRGLPPYLQHQVSFRRMLIQCPTTGSYIRGRAATIGAGRGPAYKRGLVDEAAHVERLETLFRALRASVKHGLCLNSSPLGKGNRFAQIRFDPQSTFVKLSYHWSRHPEKAVDLYCACGWTSDPDAVEEPYDQWAAHECVGADTAREDRPPREMRSPWYDVATRDYRPDEVASEHDLSYEESQRGRVWSAFDATRHLRDAQRLVGTRAARETEQQYHRRYLRRVLDPTLQTIVGWDLGVGDPTALALGQVVDDRRMRIRWVDYFEKTDESWRFYRRFVNGLWAPVVKDVTGMDVLHYCDPTGKARDSDLKSWVTNLATPPTDETADLGQPIVMITGPRVGSVLEWLDFINDLIRRGEFEILDWAARLVDILQQYHFPLDGHGVPIPGRHLAEHDEWSHGADAMRYVYMFRYHARLRRMDAGTQASTRKMLEVGEDYRPTQPRF